MQFVRLGARILNIIRLRRINGVLAASRNRSVDISGHRLDDVDVVMFGPTALVFDAGNGPMRVLGGPAMRVEFDAIDKLFGIYVCGYVLVSAAPVAHSYRNPIGKVHGNVFRPNENKYNSEQWTNLGGNFERVVGNMLCLAYDRLIIYFFKTLHIVLPSLREHSEHFAHHPNRVGFGDTAQLIRVFICICIIMRVACSTWSRGHLGLNTRELRPINVAIHIPIIAPSVCNL